MRRALVSVTNKDGVVDFCKGLVKLGFEIVSTGGTLKQLVDAGIQAIAIDDVTGFPEILDGRVKTLHPKVHGGLLYRRDLKEHVETVEKMGIQPIDLVCVNLYEFEKALKAGKPMEDMIENIDIGGPSMIRSAAKNFKDVLIVTDPTDYNHVLEAIENKTDDFDFRLNLAYKAFSTTGAYDAMISRYFAGVVGDDFPDTLNLSLKKVEHLRYGENSQQRANKYVDGFVQESLLDYEQLNGKEISFNNVNDLYGAIAVVREFKDQTVTAAIKHSTPCGVAIGDTGYDSYMKAYEADPQSIFGGIVAVNYKIDKATAEEMKKIFLEIVAAPDFDDDALEVLRTKKNLRVLKLNNLYARDAKYDIKYLEGQVLVQDIN
ncbi:MAG: bifunctional phosphoribosylaminoimidazolecarboxamide formyltransferase/IMP cyclohydrolase, partial [Coprobacillus sp.]